MRDATVRHARRDSTVGVADPCETGRKTKGVDRPTILPPSAGQRRREPQICSEIQEIWGTILL